jgi:hypothetical protein
MINKFFSFFSNTVTMKRSVLVQLYLTSLIAGAASCAIYYHSLQSGASSSNQSVSVSQSAKSPLGTQAWLDQNVSSLEQTTAGTPEGQHIYDAKGNWVGVGNAKSYTVSAHQ